GLRYPGGDYVGHDYRYFWWHSARCALWFHPAGVARRTLRQRGVAGRHSVFNPAGTSRLSRYQPAGVFLHRSAVTHGGHYLEMVAAGVFLLARTLEKLTPRYRVSLWKSDAGQLVFFTLVIAFHARVHHLEPQRRNQRQHHHGGVTAG